MTSCRTHIPQPLISLALRFVYLRPFLSIYQPLRLPRPRILAASLGALTDTGGQRKVSTRHRPQHCPGACALALKAYRLPTEVLFHAFDLV